MCGNTQQKDAKSLVFTFQFNEYDILLLLNILVVIKQMNEGKKRPKDVKWVDINFDNVKTEYKAGADKDSVNQVVVTIDQDDINPQYINQEFNKWAQLRNDDWKSQYSEVAQ